MRSSVSWNCSPRVTRTSWSSATRIIDLRVAWRGHQEHPGLRDRVSPCTRGRARGQLPLERAHPRRSQRGHRREREPSGEDAQDASNRWGENHPRRDVRRKRRSPLDRRGDRDGIRETPGLSYSGCAVLYRTNAQARALEDAFRREGVPYQVVGGVRFYERREIQDVLAYLRLISNPKDATAFGRVVNYPRRGVGLDDARALGTLGRRARAHAPGGRGGGRTRSPT